MGIKWKRRSHRNTTKKAFSIAKLRENDENILVHKQNISKGYAKFLVISLFATRALNWDWYDPDIHYPGIYII